MERSTVQDERTAARSRTPQTFGHAARPYLDALYGYCMSLSHQAADADDLLQETLLRGLRGYAGLRDPDRIRPWLFMIATNAWKDRYRSHGREPATVSLDASDDGDGFSLFETLAIEDPFPYSDELHFDFLRLFRDGDVREVFRSITPVHRMPLILTTVHGFSCKEAAAILDIPLGTLLSRMHRGRRQLERGLWDYAVRNRLVKVTDDD